MTRSLVVQPVNLDEDDVPLEFDLAIGLRKIDWILKYKFDLALEAKKGEIDKGWVAATGSK